MSDDDETYETSVRDSRHFATVKRKRINFVPASSTSSAPATPAPSGQSAVDQYLAIVMSKATKDNSTVIDPASAPASICPSREATPVIMTCNICGNPLTDSVGPGGDIVPHEASLAHQVKLGHSHPPSSIDRTRKGLALLQAHGWDPDSRLGLGARGEGMLHPITVKEKNDKKGIGIVAPKDGKAVEQPKKVQKLNAKQSRLQEAQAKKRGDMLRDMFYRDESVDKYLGELNVHDARSQRP